MTSMKENKGLFNGSCNRIACQQPGAVWFNKGTQKYYCSNCAHQINFANFDDAVRLYGTLLCVLHDAPGVEVYSG